MEKFEKIHALMKLNRLHLALNMLLSDDARNIRKEYREDLNHAWYCVGGIYFNLGNFTASKAAFRRCLSFRKDDFEALHALGNCYSELKRPALAERYFRRALLVDVQDESRRTNLEFNLANAMFDQGRLDEASKIYDLLSKTNFAVARVAEKNLTLAMKRLKARLSD